MYMNLETFEVYKSTLDPNFKGPAEEIDEMILPAIILLNKKGYKTEFCCSGHTGSDLDEKSKNRLSVLNYGCGINETYIAFSISSEAFENIKNHLPKGFTVDDGEDIVILDSTIFVAIRKQITSLGNDDIFGKLVDIYGNCIELYKMAQELPNLLNKED